MLVSSLSVGSVAIGAGAILIGVLAARKLSGGPSSRPSTAVGLLVVSWGVLELASVPLHLQFKLPVFAILLIVPGVIMLTRELRNLKWKRHRSPHIFLATSDPD